jgi:hypothetical protein
MLEYAHRWTRPRPGWKVLSEIGEGFSVPGSIALRFSTVGLLQVLVSWLRPSGLSPAELPICVLTMSCALLVWGLTRLTRQLQERVIAVHTGGILIGVWLVYPGTILRAEVITWTQVTGGTRSADSSACQIEYLRDTGEQATETFSQADLSPPARKGDQSRFHDLVAHIERHIGGLRGKAFLMVPRPVSDGDTEVQWSKRPPDADIVILADPECNRISLRGHGPLAAPHLARVFCTTAM